MSKTVVITGANRGLGLELVKIFAANAWQVIAACRDVNNFPREEQKDNVGVWQLDVSQQTSLDDFVSKAKRELKSIDVLINNAGVLDSVTDGDPVYEKLDDLTAVFAINAVGPKVLSDQLANLVVAGDAKTVISVSSHMSSHELMDEYNAEHWSYSASKAALNYAMAAFAKVHPDLHHVILHPGWLKTRLGGDDAPMEASESAQKIYKMCLEIDKQPQGRLIDTDSNVIGR